MQELYFPEAVVLDREDSNDVDSRFAIYGKSYGKVYAKAKSARKILSKLSGHLEPGSLVRIRFVGNGAWQVVDALKFGKVGVLAPDLYLLNQLLPEADFDFGIWEMLLGSPSGLPSGQVTQNLDWRETESSPSSQAHSRLHPSSALAATGKQDFGGQAGLDSTGSPQAKFSWTKVLKILGWDPGHAICEICKKNAPTHFEIGHQTFSCESCLFSRGEASLKLQQIKL